MKTKPALIAIITLYFAGMSLLGISAALPPSARKATHENIKNEILRYVPCPEFITDNNELNEVRAVVSVDETGLVTIHEINSGNKDLRAYVEKKLNGLHIRSSSTTEKFILLLKFRVA